MILDFDLKSLERVINKGKLKKIFGNLHKI